MSDSESIDECFTPGPAGSYRYMTPMGWEDDQGDYDHHKYMAEKDAFYAEDPVLKAMRLEAEAEQLAEQQKEALTPRAQATLMKGYKTATRKLTWRLILWLRALALMRLMIL